MVRNKTFLIEINLLKGTVSPAQARLMNYYKIGMYFPRTEKSRVSIYLKQR